MVLVLVLRKISNSKHMEKKSKAEKIQAGAKALAAILPLVGITWVFGLLSYSSAAVAIKYLFAIFNSLQGFFIFVFHCLLNKQVITWMIKKENE